MENGSVNRAARAAGIAADYINARGERQAIPSSIKQRLLRAMNHGFSPRIAARPLPAVRVFTRGDAMTLPLAGSGVFAWIFTTESGKTYRGETMAGAELKLPVNQEEGYHSLILMQGEQSWRCRVIIAPPRCYEEDALLAGRKLWGVCVQLYTLRSDDNWGIGDFGDLRRMLAAVAQRGGAFIGLNPIHALYPAVPENASPYSPSSRRWLNVIYIDVNAVEDFRLSAEAQDWWRSSHTQQALRAARDAKWVDYGAVTRLKITALRMAWQRFAQREKDDELVAAFGDFVTAGGESLYHQAVFDALHAQQIKTDAARWGWPVWDAAYRDVMSAEVAAFCREQADDVSFYLWLQWLAHDQMASCWEDCRRYGMPVGLYRDLAVGVASGGSETWSDGELYCLQASVGAPPDILGPLGQDWGLPPINPHVLTERAYEPYIDLLRANMAYCGALRIDHVMSMLRLWWIPKGETADRGAYVHYPMEDLLAILALESQRHRCMVIGEDLGTVPQAIVGKLQEKGVYSYKVLYFEHDKAMRFLPPGKWPAQAMAVVSTHDLPTLRGYWESGDLTLGKALGLYPDDALLRMLYAERKRARQGLLNSLRRHGYLPAPTACGTQDGEMNMRINRGAQRYVADSGSALLGLQPEEWLDMAEPVNVPGTSDQYKNWRRKLSVSLAAMFADEQINQLLYEIDRRRAGT
ncbi:4-alpha-glucanotransferase [Brenneria tiliae]|uniref:4-alpha-glucanotransferase n=1 Tax=Brenneria tiliae TaxID=2914984 RepID=A0ABT0MZH6_9GAMM|nr:4-alpha-glucanotransferase [Brenneria tiliae]MCL2895260.1 4-alpha-glucanotransferase [Brenneria tiliae]